MRPTSTRDSAGDRASALWGASTRGERRSSALWGKSGRRVAIAAVAALVLVLPTIATAGKGKPGPGTTSTTTAASSTSSTTASGTVTTTTTATTTSSASSSGPGGGKNADTTPPETTIDSGPVDGAATMVAAPTFSFSSNERGGFQCRLDGSGGFSGCSASYQLTVQPGPHALEVRAVDAAGNVDATPAKRTWTYQPYISTATTVPGTLAARAQAAPFEIFRVIIEVDGSNKINPLINYISGGGKMKRQFVAINGINAKVPGWLLSAIVDYSPSLGIVAVTEDLPVKTVEFHPKQVWPQTVKADKHWKRDAVTCETDPQTGAQVDPTCVPLAAYDPPKAPTIAVVDSGIDPNRVDEFGGRLRASVAMSELSPGASNDDNGHGTFVATMAAGAHADYPGAAPTADLVSIRVMDGQGRANTSDVIAAADWILQHKDEYGIKVANFSLHSGNANSFRFDPLDHAVERLWFAGVTVVAASGNFGDGTPQGMYYAPGNDPFVITVGAAETKDTADTSDDAVPYWSAYGHTADGFAKPELVAPGRYMIGAVPAGATLPTERPDHVVENGFMQLSGTSFASPVVAGAAAQLLALHPSWGPDEVKGALMLTAHPLSVENDLQDGVGEIDLDAAADKENPPNPNKSLNRFIVDDAAVAGGKSFDDASWADTAKADASWASASWADASWADASWASASWASASWADASWASASWADASWADASLADASWADGSKSD